MAERVRERVREGEPGYDPDYEHMIKYFQGERDRSMVGPIVVRGEELQWVQNRQARVKHYLKPLEFMVNPVLSTPIKDFHVFVQDIRTQSGKHRHQGGLVIFILEGEGYTVVEGERLDWKAGDLIMLPFKPGGVEHQHFNRHPDKSAKWIAFINLPLWEWACSEVIQLEVSPDFASD
ncbi:MAG: cupin domain-containing protein [Chloroflexi bacterium]|nr:cupin domain-containing protein [Chloroflexota bacterium]